MLQQVDGAGSIQVMVSLMCGKNVTPDRTKSALRSVWSALAWCISTMISCMLRILVGQQEFDSSVRWQMIGFRCRSCCWKSFWATWSMMEVHWYIVCRLLRLLISYTSVFQKFTLPKLNCMWLCVNWSMFSGPMRDMHSYALWEQSQVCFYFLVQLTL